MQIYAKSEKIIEIKKSRNPHKCVVSELLIKSDRRGSNPRSRPWQGRALPTTPLSHIYFFGTDNILSYLFFLVNIYFYFIVIIHPL